MSSSPEVGSVAVMPVHEYLADRTQFDAHSFVKFQDSQTAVLVRQVPFGYRFTNTFSPEFLEQGERYFKSLNPAANKSNQALSHLLNAAFALALVFAICIMFATPAR